MRHGVVQRTVVLMGLDEQVAVDLHRRRGLPWLNDDEAALLLRVDARAFRTDPLRAARLFAALLEELPVSVALTGVDVARGFFQSKPFHHAILKDRLVVDAFGDWLFPRAGATAMIEQAIALARRRRARRRLRPNGFVGGALARAPGVELARVPVGTLGFFAQARASLAARAPTMHEAVAHGARVEPPASSEALERVLIVDGPDGPACSLCADALFALLAFARDGRSRASVEDEARRLGADDDAAALVADLVADGLLCAEPSGTATSM